MVEEEVLLHFWASFFSVLSHRAGAAVVEAGVGVHLAARTLRLSARAGEAVAAGMPVDPPRDLR